MRRTNWRKEQCLSRNNSIQPRINADKHAWEEGETVAQELKTSHQTGIGSEEAATHFRREKSLFIRGVNCIDTAQ
jgi:hypothetical protein